MLLLVGFNINLHSGFQKADVIITLLSGSGRITFIELGIALANKKYVIICDETDEIFKFNNTLPFYWANNVIHVVGPITTWVREILNKFEELESNKTKAQLKLKHGIERVRQKAGAVDVSTYYEENAEETE